MGRPKSESPKTIVVQFRATPDEVQLIGKAAGDNVSNWIRTVCIQAARGLPGTAVKSESVVQKPKEVVRQKPEVPFTPPTFKCQGNPLKCQCIEHRNWRSR